MSAETLNRYIEKVRAQLSALGMLVQLGKAVPYGQQLMIQDETGQTAMLTLYAGKKGEQAVLGGKESALRQRVAAALGQASPAAGNALPARAVEQNGYVWPSCSVWAGSDESGKGDLFGPLVVASVLLTKEQAEAITALGAKDSKQLKDGQIAALAAQIKTLATDYQVVALSPSAYNRLYEAMRAEGKNLNDLLAWCHAKALSALLAEHAFSFAVIDRFSVRDLISRRVKDTPPGFSMLQIPKGERDPAVAAASILARDRYVADMNQLSAEAGVTLPKGASAGVRDCAGRLLQQFGPDEMKKYVKWHFKTIHELLGLVGDKP